MKRLQGTGAHVAGDPQTRDTTRGSNEVLFPSMREDEPRKLLHPIFCDLCGIQFGFVTIENTTGYCGETHKRIGELIGRMIAK